MPKYRERRVTTHAPATPTRPLGCGGVGPSPVLACLEGATASIFGAPPRIWPHGARNAAHGGFWPGL